MAKKAGARYSSNSSNYAPMVAQGVVDAGSAAVTGMFFGACSDNEDTTMMCRLGRIANTLMTAILIVGLIGLILFGLMFALKSVKNLRNKTK